MIQWKLKFDLRNIEYMNDNLVMSVNWNECSKISNDNMIALHEENILRGYDGSRQWFNSSHLLYSIQSRVIDMLTT